MDTHLSEISLYICDRKCVYIQSYVYFQFGSNIFANEKSDISSLLRMTFCQAPD